MKTAFSFHSHVIIVDSKPTILGVGYYDNGVRVYCDTASVPYVICRAALFAVDNNIRSITIDGAELKRTVLPN